MPTQTIIQNAFHGEWSDLCGGRTDHEGYLSALTKLENFIPLLQGGIAVSPGTQYIAGAKNNDKQCRLVPFKFSRTQAYIIEFGDLYCRFYKDKGQIVSGAAPYEITTPYLEADLSGLKFFQSADTLYVCHESYAPRKITRTGHTSWTIQVINFSPPAIREIPWQPSTTIAPAATTGSGITFTAGTGIFQSGDVNRLIVSGTARAAITAYVGATQVTCDIIDDFSSTDPIASGSWEIQGSPSAALVSTKSGPAGAITSVTAKKPVNILSIVDPDYKWTKSGGGTNEYYLEDATGGDPQIDEPDIIYENGSILAGGTAGSLGLGDWDWGLNGYYVYTDLTDGTLKWTPSGSGTNEYYLEAFLGGDPGISDPDILLEDGIALYKASAKLGSLGIAQWGYGNNDALGFNTVYVRLTDETDPDTKASEFIQAGSWSAGAFSTVHVRMTANYGGYWDPDAQAEGFIQAGYQQPGANAFRSTDVGKYIVMHNGVIRITGYTSATKVTGVIVKELDTNDKTVAWTLEEEMWTAALGYPSCGVFHSERLCLGGSSSFPQTVVASRPGDYENMGKGANDGDALEFTIAAKEVNSIVWMESRGSLILGTVGGEWRVGSEESLEPLTPTNVFAKEQSGNGSAETIEPIKINTLILFWQYQAKKLIQMGYSYDQNSYVSSALTLYAPHIVGSGITAMAYQKEPHSILWNLRADGKLAGFTFLPEQQKFGWFRRSTDGVVESIASIPGAGQDDLYMVVKRTINGQTSRYIEVLAPYFDDDAATYTSNKGLNAIFLDSSLTYNGAAATTITGLAHLEGEIVGVLGDGAAQADKTVSGGQITLDTAASVVHVGLRYTPEMKPMRPDGGFGDGTAQARLKKIIKLYLRFYRSNPEVCSVGPDDGGTLDALQYRHTLMDPDNPSPLFTGDIEIEYRGGFETDGRFLLRVTQPLPVTILAAIADLKGNS